MEYDVMLGEMSGKRRPGRPITRWLDNVNNIKGPSINSMIWDARDQDIMEKCYSGYRQGSDTTRRHIVLSCVILCRTVFCRLSNDGQRREGDWNK